MKSLPKIWHRLRECFFFIKFHGCGGLEVYTKLSQRLKFIYKVVEVVDLKINAFLTIV